MSNQVFQAGGVWTRFALMAAGALGITGSASAAVVGSKTSIASQVSLHSHTGSHAVVVMELHHIKGELEKADHDYSGHRAAAVKDITAAIHALAPHHNKPSTTAKVPHPVKPAAAHLNHTKPGTAKNKLPQATSDAMLNAAAMQLQAVKTQLTGKGAEATLATAEISKALAELDTALKIK